MPYERTTGGALLTVESLCRHLTNSGTFSATSAPTLTQVYDFLALGQADVMAQLAKYGYGTALPSDQMGRAWLEKMNVFRACMNIEMTYPVTEWGQNNERMAAFQNQWDEGIEVMQGGGLISIGISSDSDSTSTPVMTGISRSRKSMREIEEDRVAGKFPRGFGQRRDIMGGAGYFDPNSAP